MTFTTDELRSLAILDGLPEEQIAWLRDHGTKLEVAAGDRMFERGQPADFMLIVVAGTIQRFEDIGGRWLLVATTQRGEVTGMLPYSRMTHYPGHTIAAEPSHVLRIAKRDFEEMLTVSHELGQRLVALMADRVRGDVRLEQQREKLMALGRLSAGLAHELNNPAAAMRRTAATLATQLPKQRTLMMDMLRRGGADAEVTAIERLRRLAGEREASTLSPLDRSAREDDVTEWLEHRAVPDAADVASVFVHAGLTVEDLEDAARVTPGAFPAVAAAYAAALLDSDRMIAEIESSSNRISELISSVKVYSHMDRSSEHKPTDVREGLDNTLTMFGHKLKRKNLRLVRQYGDDVPVIPANAGELNQVWTNLIDNAVDAAPEGGELRLEIRADLWCVDVSIIDDGPDIPKANRAQIFDPFFTTKDVGEGTGLGLDIARRIVATHQGQIDVHSKPGRTEMCVRLPILPTSPG